MVQVRPVSYAGHFHSSADPMIERVWWTAAWTVKACMQTSYFGSILMDRGDRESWCNAFSLTRSLTLRYN